MSFRILDALADGLRRTLSRNGLVFAVAMYVLSAVNLLFVPAQTGVAADPEASPVAEPAIGVSAGVGLAVVAVTSILSLYLLIVIYRTFTSDETDGIPDGAVSSGPIWALVNVLVGYVVFFALVLVGTILFVIPGLFLLVALWFFDVAVAAEGDNFVAAMRRSWGLTSGNRLRLFALGFVVTVVMGAFTVAFAIPQVVIGSTAGLLVGQIGTSVAAIFTYATTAAAYTQLRELRGNSTAV